MRFVISFIHFSFSSFLILFFSRIPHRTEYDWSDSPGMTPYKLIDAGTNIRMRLGRTSSTESDTSSTPTSGIRVKIE